MSERLALFFLFFPVFLFSLSFHEAAHAWAANRLGDDTAKKVGRLTLNPLVHVDWIGTVLFPLLMFLFPGLLLFGWAKPVPINPVRFSRKVTMGTGMALTGLAGPLSNIALALLFAGLFRLLFVSGRNWEGGMARIVGEVLTTGVLLNLSLAFFNLIPIPPLDGSRILPRILPRRARGILEALERYGFLLLLICLYLGVFRYLSIPIYGMAELLLP